MKTIIIALATTSALAFAVPAGAQTAGANIDLRVDRLQGQLQAGVQSGAITRAEAMPLRQQLRQLAELERQYARGGFTMQERTDLRSRMISLRQGIRIASQNGDDRYDREDRYDRDRDCPPGLARKNNGCLPPGQVGRDDRDGRWGDNDRRGTAEWIDRNRDGFDDRDLNRDRRIDDREWRLAGDRYDRDDDRYDRDGDRYDRDDDRYERDGDRYERDDERYEDRAPARGGIGGVIDNILGGGTLRVGQRVSGNLGAVPYEYRSQYRDGNGVYYRSDGRSIYQVDARTDTVLRVYSMRR
jgi:hypothetical protein